MHKFYQEMRTSKNQISEGTMKYGFNEKTNTMVITTKGILEKRKNILFISHDEDDGIWEFLDGVDVKEEDAAIVSIFEIVEIDPSINFISDLPMGWVAYRNDIESDWVRCKYLPE